MCLKTTDKARRSLNNTPRLHLKFGAVIHIQRGGHKKPSLGQYRLIKVKYIGARGSRICCRLLQDDKDASGGYCTKTGDVGWWERSIICNVNNL